MRATALTLATLSVLAPARAGTLIVSGARIATGTGVTHDGGTVVVTDGRITHVLPPGAVVGDLAAGAQRLDATGMWLTPGIVDADTAVGIREVSLVPATVDTEEEAGPLTPQVRTVDAFNPLSQVVEITRAGGVLVASVNPGGGNVLSGRTAVILLDGRTNVVDSVLREPAALMMNLGEGPKAKFGERKEMPSTRMGTAAVVREAFTKAAEHRAKLAAKGPGKDGKKPEPPEHDPRWEALLPALDGKMPVMVRAHRADDIETALRLSKELSLDMVLLGGAEAWKLAPRLAAASVPVVYSPPLLQPDGMDRLQAVEDAPARLHAAGVTVALASGDAHNSRNLPIYAGRAVAFGLPWDAALAAITSVPARILGVSDRAGTVEVGRPALLVLWSGDPLEASSLPRKIVIGESVTDPDSVLERNQRPWRKP